MIRPNSPCFLIVGLLTVSAFDLYATTVGLVSSANPAVFGAPLTLIATVIPASATGKVTFYSGVSVLGTATLSGGTAALPTALNVTGTRSLVARYLGDHQNLPAASPPVIVTVNALPASGFNSSNLDMGIAVAGAATGDFNNDGRADIVAVGSSNIVKVALGNGDGTFAAPIGTILPLHASLLSVVVGDFNQDGYEDIALSDVIGNSVAVIFGNGDGTFGTSVLLPTAAGQIVVADFNADGFPDLAVLHRSSSSVGILLGSANGTFGTPTEFPFAPYLYNMIAGDVNNDGNVDLLTVVSPAQNDSREVIVLLGDGTGGFSAQINGSSFAFFYNPWDSYALEDLNGDGKPDLVLAPGWGYQIGIFPGNGDGTFGQPTYYPISNDLQYTGGAYGISVVDFNGDGMPDVLSERGINSSGQPRKSLDLYTGKGDGTVQPLGVSSVSLYYLNIVDYHTSLILADFNQDGKIDIAGIVASSDTSIEILEGAVLPLPQVVVTHAGTFAPGQQGANFTVSVNNAPGAATTTGLLTISDFLGQGADFVSLSGDGWACSSTTCSRSDALSPGASYPPITLTVDVQANPPFPQLFNAAELSGGGGSVISSGTDTAALQVTEAPPAPGLVGPANGSSGVSLIPLLVWNLATGATGATSYDIYLGASSTPPFVGSTTGNSYSPGTLSSGTTYYWRIVGKNSAGSTSSTIRSFTTISQTFVVTYAAANGYRDLQWVQMLFAVATDGGGQAFCLVHYDVQGGAFWLYGDGGFFVGPVTPGTSSNLLQNALCALSTSESSVSGYGSTLTVNANVVFKAAGARNIYWREMSMEGNDTGWVQQRTWTMSAAALGTMTVSPSSGSVTNGTQQTFTLTYPDTPGFAGAAFGWEQFLAAVASDGGGQPYCYVHYDRGGNGLWMYSSDVGFFLGPVKPGTSSSLLTSSACSVNTASATVQIVSGNLVLSVPITLKSPMVGSQKLFERALTVLNVDTGLVQTGALAVN